MKNDCRMSMRSLSIQVEKITTQYRAALIKQKLSQTHFSEQPNKKSDYCQFIEAFEIALNGLAPDHRMIIYNDYINQELNFWWEVKFARSTYYRQKYRALHKFVAFFQYQ